jgi:hypothetical protein
MPNVKFKMRLPCDDRTLMTQIKKNYADLL